MKKTLLLHTISILSLSIPNLCYLIFNYEVLSEAHAVTLSMVVMVILSIVGLGSLCHFKIKAGVWVTIVGAFILALSNISYVAGIALIIEGVGLVIDGYILRPAIINAKTKELEANGKQVTYTRRID